MRHEVIVGVERRRWWSVDVKLSILMEVGVDGATVAEVARRHDLTRQHIYQWRHELRRKGILSSSGDAVFLALDAPHEEAIVNECTPSGATVEIVLGNGRELRLHGGVDDADVMRLIRLVESA